MPPATASDAAPYEHLCTLVEHQLQLAGEARFSELDQAVADTARYIATLPAVPPLVAADALERATLIHKRLEIELQRGREALLLAANTVASGRRALSGYAPSRTRPHRVQIAG